MNARPFLAASVLCLSAYAFGQSSEPADTKPEATEVVEQSTCAEWVAVAGELRCLDSWGMVLANPKVSLGVRLNSGMSLASVEGVLAAGGAPVCQVGIRNCPFRAVSARLLRGRASNTSKG